VSIFIFVVPKKSAKMAIIQDTLKPKRPEDRYDFQEPGGLRESVAQIREIWTDFSNLRQVYVYVRQAPRVVSTLNCRISLALFHACRITASVTERCSDPAATPCRHKKMRHHIATFHPWHNI